MSIARDKRDSSRERTLITSLPNHRAKTTPAIAYSLFILFFVLRLSLDFYLRLYCHGSLVRRCRCLVLLHRRQPRFFISSHLQYLSLILILEDISWSRLAFRQRFVSELSVARSRRFDVYIYILGIYTAASMAIYMRSDLVGGGETGDTHVIYDDCPLINVHWNCKCVCLGGEIADVIVAQLPLQHIRLDNLVW